jgi:light-regulated signal transduction histidine kinase (bacteriophytochrome)
VRDNAAKMSRLIDDILSFSRSGRVELRFTPVDMEQQVREVWFDLEPTHAGRNVRLDLNPLPLAYGDPAMLRQVWINLLSNAIKFTRPRAEAVIEVGCVSGPGAHTYYVHDNGVGFDPAYVHKLFGVFQRLHGVNEFEGTGIGLAIVKRIVTRHGGGVEADAKVGEGTTIRFTLPIQEG